jgi:hypothetical protein
MYNGKFSHPVPWTAACLEKLIWFSDTQNFHRLVWNITVGRKAQCYYILKKINPLESH